MSFASWRNKSREWWIDFLLVSSTLLLSESARGIVVPTLNQYVNSLGGDSFFLSIVVAAFSFGRLFASFIFGLLSDYWSTKKVLLLSIAVCVIGNIMFISAESLGYAAVLLVSRIFTGFGTGMLSVARAHVGVTTPLDERTEWMSFLGIVQFVGFAATPVFGGFSVDVNLGIIQITSYTAATLVLLLLEILMFGLLYFFMSNATSKGRQERQIPPQSIPEVNGNELHSHFDYQQFGQINQEIDRQEIEEQKEQSQHILSITLPSPMSLPAVNNTSTPSTPSTLTSPSPPLRVSTITSPRFNWSYISMREWTIYSALPLVFVTLNLTGRGILAVAETYGTSLYYQISDPGNLAHTNTDAGTFYLILGAAGTVVFLLMSRLVKCCGDAPLLLYGFLSMSIGYLMLSDADLDDYDVTYAEYVIGMILIWVIGTPISQTLVVSLLSKHLSKDKQGRWMGAITAAGSIGRIIIPIIAGALYNPTAPSEAMLFVTLVGFLSVIIICIVLQDSWRIPVEFILGKYKWLVGGFKLDESVTIDIEGIPVEISGLDQDEDDEIILAPNPQSSPVSVSSTSPTTRPPFDMRRTNSNGTEMSPWINIALNIPPSPSNAYLNNGLSIPLTVRSVSGDRIQRRNSRNESIGRRDSSSIKQLENVSEYTQPALEL